MNKKFLIINFILVLLVLIYSSACGGKPESSTQSSATETYSSTSTLPSTATMTGTTTEISSPTTAGETAAVTGKEFIWKISSATAVVYLLGSIHVGEASLYPLDGAIDDAFNESDNLVVEINAKELDTNTAAALMFEYGTYPQDNGLKNSLPESLYTRLSEEFSNYGINLGLLDRFRPWVISTTLEQLVTQELGYSAEFGIDTHFLEKATTDGKPVLELESAEYQMQVMSSISDDVIIMTLENDLNNPPTRENMSELFTIWQRGDISGMESLVFGPLDQIPELLPFYEVMFNKRNANMINKIEGYLEDEEIYFVVVGAGHLIGDNGLIYLLSEKNYMIEQLEDTD